MSLDDDQLVALFDVIGRTGASSVQVRYDDSEQPVVWMGVARYPATWEVAAGRQPLEAMQRLGDRLLDGGRCLHCGRVTALVHDPLERFSEEQESSWCVYRYDPENRTYRRMCEGRRDG